MKTSLFVFSLLFVAISLPIMAADTPRLAGTWSGNWTPKGGIQDALTIELKQDDSGKLSGKFLNPVAMDFSKAVFNAATRTLTLEATDGRSGKQYKLDGKVQGNELKGTLVVDGITGDLLLIKWTYFGR